MCMLCRVDVFLCFAFIFVPLRSVPVRPHRPAADTGLNPLSYTHTHETCNRPGFGPAFTLISAGANGTANP